MKHIRERKEESTHTQKIEHTRVGVAMINTEHAR